MSAATELELESELNLESEQELAGELENEFELAQEITNELELEHEQEGEHEAFFNHLAAMADRGGRSQALRSIALAAAKSALRGQRRSWPVVEGELGELESELGEFEAGYEMEFESSPAQEAQMAAMMEHEGHAAAEAANEQEAAEHFLPLIGLAAKFVLPKLAGMAAKKFGGKILGKVGGQLLRRVAPKLIRRVAPQLTRGVANITRTLFRNRSTRPLIHAVPRIARTTVARLGRQIAAGKRITPQTAVRTLARQTARTLGNPRALAQTYRRSLALDRRYHKGTRRVLGRPTGAPVRAANDPGFQQTPNMGSATPLGGVTPIVPTVPFAGGFQNGNAPGTCSCRCGQSAAAAPGPMFAPQMAAPPIPTTCPTCGR